MNSIALTRTLLIYGLILPLAAILGYMLTTPLDPDSLKVIGVVAFALTTPLLIRSHQVILLFSWNAVVTFSFLPGTPHFWMLMAVLSLGFAMVNRVLDRHGTAQFCHVPAVTYTLLFLALVVILTAKMTGGIGLRSLGSSSYGSKGYVYLLAAIIGYFAMTSSPISALKARLVPSLFFLPGLTSLLSTLIYYAGPTFFVLYAIFPSGDAVALSTGGADAEIVRLGGLGGASMAGMFYLLARYGIGGVLTVNHPWRFLVFALVLVISLFSGFRSSLIFVGMIFGMQFYFEGQMRTRLFPVLAIAGVFFMVLLVPLADRLPMAMQRTLSFLPVQVDPAVRSSAENSTKWRLEMWEMLWPDLPKYIFVGKGYAINPTDLYMTDVGVRSGRLASWEGSLAAGDYHSGPLSIYVPFGSFGVLAFLFFLIASIRTLHQNYRYGEAHLRTINTFLLAAFIARSIFFFFVFGSISSELFAFTGTIGLSVALNGGVKQDPVWSPAVAVSPTTRDRPARRRLNAGRTA